jgi:hypothetical protein
MEKGNVHRWLGWVPANETRDSDYSVRFTNALRGICSPDYPAGMIPWLRIHYPTLYDELTNRLPDQIHQLWTEHAPLGQFDRVLATWSDTHRKACELYLGR